MAKKEKLRVFVSSSCGPCQELKDNIEAGRFNHKDVDLIDVETEEGFKYIKQFGLTKAPAAYLGKKECEIFINREDNSVFIDCPSKGKAPSLPQRVAEPS